MKCSPSTFHHLLRRPDRQKEGGGLHHRRQCGGQRLFDTSLDLPLGGHINSPASTAAASGTMTTPPASLSPSCSNLHQTRIRPLAIRKGAPSKPLLIACLPTTHRLATSSGWPAERSIHPQILHQLPIVVAHMRDAKRRHARSRGCHLFTEANAFAAVNVASCLCAYANDPVNAFTVSSFEDILPSPSRPHRASRP